MKYLNLKIFKIFTYHYLFYNIYKNLNNHLKTIKYFIVFKFNIFKSIIQKFL
jgi:hypothetical protein